MRGWWRNWNKRRTRDELPTIEHRGQALWLLADKAIYWPARRALLVADVHIGKAASYRALHQPVPRGTTEATLARLDRLLAAQDCEQLIILGDFLHARAPVHRQRWPKWMIGASGTMN